MRSGRRVAGHLDAVAHAGQQAVELVTSVASGPTGRGPVVTMADEQSAVPVASAPMQSCRPQARPMQGGRAATAEEMPRD